MVTGNSSVHTGQFSRQPLYAAEPVSYTHLDVYKRQILRGITAEFKAGEVIGIVGPSGAGKSTLARCLVGIWPDVQGRVLLDGHAVGDWQREALGPHLGYLPQDIELLDGSIAENIARFGEVDSEQVIEAARRTGLHDMILRLPKGYDCLLYTSRCV